MAVYAAIAAFATYACIFSYRKAFTVATFEDLRFFGLPYQTLLIISQVLGYMLAKFYGIRFIAVLKRLARWKSIALLVGWAWLALFCFALTPPPYGMVFFFLNGFPLGLLWGIVFSYVEGRRTTDFIGAALAVSFIFSGGFSRSVAKWLILDWNVPEQWVAFATGMVFAVPLAFFVWMLERVPIPDAADIEKRTIRVPMTRADRKNFLAKFGFGIVVVTITYLFLTIIRELRDSFMANIWNELGYGSDYAIFTRTETPTFLLVLLLMSLLVFVQKNGLAFRIIHWVIITGFFLAGISSWMFVNGQAGPVTWMSLVGLGLYMAYIPFNCVFFERMIATFGIASNVGFLIYIADSFGYLGSVSVMLVKEFSGVAVKWSVFYPNMVVWFSMIGVAGSLVSLYYFTRREKELTNTLTKNQELRTKN